MIMMFSVGQSVCLYIAAALTHAAMADAEESHQPSQVSFSSTSPRVVVAVVAVNNLPFDCVGSISVHVSIVGDVCSSVLLVSFPVHVAVCYSVSVGNHHISGEFLSALHFKSN